MEVGVVGASKRDHRVAMQKGSERRFGFVRRTRRRHEIHTIKVKTLLRGFGHSDVASMNRIERSAEERNRARMRVRFLAGNGAQIFSGR